MSMHYCQQGRVARVSRHRVLMQFFHRKGWHVSFLEEDCKTTLTRRLTFAYPEKIIEMQQRWGEIRTEAARSDLERHIALGRPGSAWLILTAEEYARLKR